MKKLISIALAGLMVLSLASCAKAGEGSSSASEETSVSTSDTEKEQSDVSKNFSFTSVEGDKQTASVSAVEPEEGKAKTPYGGEEYAKVKFGDLDGDGTEEYAIAYEVQDGDIYSGEIDLYFNNELIYEFEDELIIEPGLMKYEDYDGDGDKEILFVYYPHVNSMPLDEYAVLKQKNGLWDKLKAPVDANGSNGFPVHVKYGDEPCMLKISCDGCDKVIDYDATAHYQNLSTDESYEYYKDEYLRVLNGEGFVKGADYGMVLPWGIWEVDGVMHNDEPCIRALHGLAGAQLERYDYLGNLYIYFRFDENGKVKIVDMEFFDDLSAGIPE